MLTRSERTKILASRFFSTVGLLPAEVDTVSGEIRPVPRSLCRKPACAVSFPVCVAHGLYKILILVYMRIFLRETPLHHMILHVVFAGISAAIIFWYYILYIVTNNFNYAQWLQKRLSPDAQSWRNQQLLPQVDCRESKGMGMRTKLKS